MNKENIIKLLITIHNSKIILLIGIAVLFIGIGASYQAQHDVIVLNESLYFYANSNVILTDGNSYYQVVRYNTNLSSVNYLLNLSQCQALYGDK